jgi:hypothetical protein
MSGIVAPKLVTVIVVNYNGGTFLRSCIEGLLHQTFHDFDVIIIDNGSNDGSLEQLPALPSSFQVVHAHRNLGFAVANNVAARRTSSPWIAALNPMRSRSGLARPFARCCRAISASRVLRIHAAGR